MTLEQKKRIAELMFYFDPYGEDDIMEEENYKDLFDDKEDIIADLKEWYIDGELTEPDNPYWLDLIKSIREV